MQQLIQLLAGRPAPEGSIAEYPLHGQAQHGGPYNSHVVSAFIFVALAATGVIHPGLAAWVAMCLLAALLLDDRAWRRKILLSAIPQQMALYIQVLVRAVVDALPFYLLAYLVYIFVAPYCRAYDLAVSSFVMLYAFYMAVRIFWLVKYLWLLTYRWESAGQTFAVQEANLKSQSTAIRHVAWAYFLGNIGLIVRCASQVMTIGLFEWMRRVTPANVTQHPQLNERLLWLAAGAAIVWIVTMGIAIRRALLVYYRTHRTFHQCRPLYDSIHAIHHRGVLPTPLDSGTISPLEFLITENALPAATLLPNWWWTASQIVIAVVGHWPSHDAGVRWTFPQHHLQHHRYFTVNYGLTPAEDEFFGTLQTEPGAGAGRIGDAVVG